MSDQHVESGPSFPVFWVATPAPGETEGIIDIPEDKLAWVERVTAEYVEVQTYLYELDKNK